VGVLTESFVVVRVGSLDCEQESGLEPQQGAIARDWRGTLWLVLVSSRVVRRQQAALSLEPRVRAVGDGRGEGLTFRPVVF
jgi:hypothetical protein